MTESQTIINAYLGYFELGGVSGLAYQIGDDQITLYQETDEDEEETKYRIFKEDGVVPADWDRLVVLLRGMED